jgi:hypothetical protein
MSTKLIVTGASTWAYRYDFKELGGRWNRDLQAWLLPVSRRHQVEKLVKGSDVDVDMYDTATGQIIPLPRVFTYGGQSYTFFPLRYRAAQTDLGRKRTTGTPETA